MTVRGTKVVDKLDVTLNPEIPMTDEFERECKKVRRMPSKLYKEQLDLKQIGIKAMLFKHCRFNATNKLALFGVGNLTLQDVSAMIVRIFDCDPWGLRLSRIDLAIDLHGVSMESIRTHVRVVHRRSYREERRDSPPLEGASGMTIYMGRGDDLFRFYDKRAQLLAVRSKRETLTDCDCIVTRIERQLRTSKIPTSLSTLRDLEIRGMEFNPFRPLRFLVGGRKEPALRGYAVRTFLEGTGLRRVIEDWGFARTWGELNSRSEGNAARTIRRLAEFAPPDTEGFQVLDLFAMYRSSLSLQLGPSGSEAPTTTAVPDCDEGRDRG